VKQLRFIYGSDRLLSAEEEKNEKKNLSQLQRREGRKMTTLPREVGPEYHSHQDVFQSELVTPLWPVMV